MFSKEFSSPLDHRGVFLTVQKVLTVKAKIEIDPFLHQFPPFNLNKEH